MPRIIATIMLFIFAIGAAPSGGSAAARTAAYLEAIRTDTDPTRLTEFLADLPKGGDLHHHLSGAVYAESCINYAANYAAADGDCFDPTFTIVAPPCDAAKGLSPASRAQTDYAFRNLTRSCIGRRSSTRCISRRF